MRRATTIRSFAAWAALLAVLGAALAPALSHAFAPGKDVTKWVEVCSATGPMTIEVPAGGPGFPKAPKASDFEHCPFCSAQAAPAAILPPTLSVLLLPAASELVSPLFLHAPRPLFAWISAQPRAPPFAS
jgi:hypothetical protein